MEGVFWHGDMGFVVDPCKMSSNFPDARTIERWEIGESLKASGKLPSLGPAPVASWMLARLFQLTKERLGFDTHDRRGSDGGGYYLNFVAFSRHLKPEAFFYVHGDSAGVRFWGTCAANVSPETVVTNFTEAVLENPTELTVCKLTTVDTDPPDLKRRYGKPHVFGWDGNKFLGFRKNPAAD
jgi:hypothetical protein